MRVCYFGVYDSQYSRNKVIIKGLRENGVEVLECVSRAPGALNKFFDLVKKHRLVGKYDIMVVGFPGQQAMLLAKLLSRQPIIFDAFTSQYDSVVKDRQTVRRWHPKAWYLWLSDWPACVLADKILLDTGAHIDYFVKEFGIRRDKFICVRVGSDISDSIAPAESTRLFAPAESARQGDSAASKPLLVHFHGSGLPLQGYEYVVEAAKLLQDQPIKFRLVGTKIKDKYAGQDSPNIEFLDNVDFRELTRLIAQADICLGVFGKTDKAGRVIPNKVYEALALGKPVLTRDSPSIREIFEDRKHLLLCRPADPQDLAEKILSLKKDAELAKTIAQKGYEYFQEYLTPKKIGQNLLKILP